MKKSNPINVSGTKFENEVEDVLEKSGHPFRKTNKCDYELITDKGLKGHSGHVLSKLAYQFLIKYSIDLLQIQKPTTV